MKVGSRILINDGEVELIVEKISTDKIETKVKQVAISHLIKELIYQMRLFVYQLLQRKKDIQFLLEENVDFIACSFRKKT